MLMLAAFLVSRPSFDHYLLVVLLPLLASVAVAGSVPRTVWFWVALVPQVSGFAWPYLEAIQRRAFRDAATLWLLAAVTARACAAAAGGADGDPGGDGCKIVRRFGTRFDPYGVGSVFCEFVMRIGLLYLT